MEHVHRAASVTSVYRAPLRSRRDDIDPQLTLDRAQLLELCGFGGDRDLERLARRVERFAQVPDGSLVWTRDAHGLYRIGRIDGPYFYDADGESVDLVHVRRCRWRDAPIIESLTPAAVVATFGRGGRNFQQIHDALVGDESLRLWDRTEALDGSDRARNARRRKRVDVQTRALAERPLAQ